MIWSSKQLKPKALRSYERMVINILAVIRLSEISRSENWRNIFYEEANSAIPPPFAFASYIAWSARSNKSEKLSPWFG